MCSASTRFAVLGAGAAGCGLASLIARRARVTLFNRTSSRVDALAARGLFVRDGGQPSRVELQCVTSRLEAAVRGADVLVVATNSTAHRELAVRLAPLLRAEQAVLLVPGHTGGALEFRHALLERGGSTHVAVGETDALPFVARFDDSGTLVIFQHKAQVQAAFVGGSAHTLDMVRSGLPDLTFAPNVLWTSLGNLTVVFQVPLMIANAARIDAAEPFTFYRAGASKAVCRVIEAVDAERVALARQYGIELPSAADWLSTVYGSAGERLDARLHNTPGYAELMAPRTLEHRFLVEYIPMGVVPMLELAALARCPAPCLRALAALAGALGGTNYAGNARTLRRLGIVAPNPNMDAVKRAVEGGR